MKTTWLTLFAVFAGLSACSDGTAKPPFRVEPLPLSAPVPSSSPRLEQGANGQIILSWLSPANDQETTLHYSRLWSGNWGEIKTVITAPNMFVNWADLPSVVAISDTKLAAHWLQLAGGEWYAYHVMIMQSLDDGASWSNPMRAHEDSSKTEHGFVSMYPIDDRLGALWLDGNKTGMRDADNPHNHGMTLRSRTFGNDMDAADRQEIDGLICDCCQTDVAVAASGPIAVYRDRTAGEVRDISVTRHIDGQWQAPTTIHDDGWEINGCPVNGPSITANNKRVAVAWFSGVPEPIVQLALSDDSGESFAKPIEIVRGDTLGRVAVAQISGGYAVSWLSNTDKDGMAVRFATVYYGDPKVRTYTVTENASGMAVPQMVSGTTDLYFAWTENDDAGTRIASARIFIAGLKP